MFETLLPNAHIITIKNNKHQRLKILYISQEVTVKPSKYNKYCKKLYKEWLDNNRRIKE